MKAMLIDENKNLVWSEVEKAAPKDDEILIKIYAAALNRADLLQRKGAYPLPKGWPEWMGLEVSGVIEAMGERAKKESGKKSEIRFVRFWAAEDMPSMFAHLMVWLWICRKIFLLRKRRHCPKRMPLVI